MSLLELRGLTMRFGGLTAVNIVDVVVRPGEIFALIGPNGAGKTTVFNAVTGIYEPTEGHVLFEQRDLRRPFTGRVALGAAAIALMTGLLLPLALQAEAMWRAGVTANYVWQEPFPWSKAVGDAGDVLASGRVAATALVGFLLGGAGALVVWQRQRRAPHVVAARGLARTFQNIRLFPEMTVLENVLVAMDLRLRARLWHMLLRLPLHHREERQARERALTLLESVGLRDRADTVARNLPYGDQRRLEIVRALATEPKLLLLDEPAAGMNPSESADLMKLIRKLRDAGATILLIEHDMKVVMGISDRIAVLHYGTKIAEGTPADIRANPAVIEAYLGREE